MAKKSNKNKTKIFFVLTILLIIIATMYISLENSKKDYEILEITQFEYFLMVSDNKIRSNR